MRNFILTPQQNSNDFKLMLIMSCPNETKRLPAIISKILFKMMTLSTIKFFICIILAQQLTMVSNLSLLIKVVKWSFVQCVNRRFIINRRFTECKLTIYSAIYRVKIGNLQCDLHAKLRWGLGLAPSKVFRIKRKTNEDQGW